MMSFALWVALTIAAPDAPPVAVVEMFTSQGCSSCPPADAVLRRLSRAGESEGVEVIPLAFHVDYWNQLGWRDPFSSPRWSERQRAYARALPSSVYTPQAVIQGQAHAVGSRRAELRRAIRDHAYRGPRSLRLSAVRRGDSVRVRVRGHRQPNAELVVLLTENGQNTDVTRGENRGRALRNDAIVRALERVKPSGEGELEEALTLPVGQVRNAALSVVAFWQEAKSQRIHDAARSAVR